MTSRRFSTPTCASIVSVVLGATLPIAVPADALAAGQPAAPAAAGAVAARTHAASGTPAIVVAVAVLAAVLVLLVALWLLARWTAWEPRWWRHMNHAGAEASFHLETTWAEFRDWLRLGR